jgi:hypothetical protein
MVETLNVKAETLDQSTFPLEVNMGIELWRDISLIVLICPAMLLSLLPLAVLGGMIYGLRMLHLRLPPFFTQVRAVTARIHLAVERASQAAAAPIIASSASAARAQGWKNYITKELKR